MPRSCKLEYLLFLLKPFEVTVDVYVKSMLLNWKIGSGVSVSADANVAVMVWARLLVKDRKSSRYELRRTKLLVFQIKFTGLVKSTSLGRVFVLFFLLWVFLLPTTGYAWGIDIWAGHCQEGEYISKSVNAQLQCFTLWAACCRLLVVD